MLVSEAPWLVLLFVPTAFSFVCGNEVQAYQNCHKQFRDRNCSLVVVSTESKHTLWHWTCIPYGHGGLGYIDIPLLSDPSHKISTDYGVLAESKGEGKEHVKLRGTFVVDGDGILQQVRLPLCHSLV